ncbi:MAG: beta galactosidase jelly roll domain-containing protein [Thermoleophilaceae bacterium]|nr:beta galactosidase jelly roll domain-containing protein [Thermoleophilaceae bacterium]
MTSRPRGLLAAALTGAVALLAAAPSTPAQSADVTTPSSRVVYHDGYGGRYLLDGPWWFRLDQQDQGVAQGLQRQESLDGWTQVSVPNAWNAGDDSPESQRGTVGWYRKDFRLPRGAGGATWRIRFESVNYRATVWVNGRQMGRHEGGYVPFEVPAGALRPGVNHLVVRVDSRHSNTDLPPLVDRVDSTPGGGWWNYGGLLREVYLRRVYRVDIASFLARPTLPCRRCDATVLLRATLHNLGRRAQVRLRASVGGRNVRFPAVTLPARGTRRVSARIGISHPRLWEPGHPRLYKVRAAAYVGGRLGSSYSAHIGIRSIEVRRGYLYVNGVRTTLLGASIHEDDPVVGAALTPERRRSIFSQLLDLGARITRAHYPLHPDFLEQADRAGVLVWEQVPVYRLGESQLKLSSVRAKGLRYLRAAIERDQNHPSVLTWSIGNELPSRPALGQRRYIAEATRLVRRLDPTRLVALDVSGYPTVPRVAEFDALDALGINDYFGWYPGPNGQLLDRSALGPYLDQMRGYYPRLALFITEFGAEANRHGPVDEKGTYEFQSDWMRFQLSTIASKPYIDGAISWILRDFKVRPGWNGGNPVPRPPYNQKGLADELGHEKPAFAVAQSFFRAASRARDARAARLAR